MKKRSEVLWLMDKQYGIDESKRPNMDGAGVVGSFRKLEID